MNPETCHVALIGLFTWVIKNSLAATALIGLVLVIQWLGGKRLSPFWGYVLWMMVAARLVLPAAPPSNFSLLNHTQFLSGEWIAETSQRAGDGPAAKVLDVAPGNAPIIPERLSRAEAPDPLNHKAIPNAPHIKTEPPPKAPSPSVPQPRPGLTSPAQPATPLTWQSAVAFTWAIGVVGYLLAVLAQCGILAARLRRQKPLDDPRILALLHGARTELNVRDRLPIVELPRLAAPALFGIFRPRLLLPQGMREHLEPEALRHVLLHELTHLKHRDGLVNWLLILVQACHWFNPAVWLALARLRADRELFCDAAVLARLSRNERHAYGNTLLKVCGLISTPSFSPGLVPILQRKPQIQRRIVMITEFKPSSRLSATAAALLTLSLVGLTFTGAAEKEVPPPKTEPQKAETSMVKEKADRPPRDERLSRDPVNYKAMLEKHQAEIKRIEQELDRSGYMNSTEALAEQLRQLAGKRIEAQSEYQRLNTLHRHLTALSQAELKKAMATAMPDTLLSSLLDKRAAAEQKMAELEAMFATDHPDVQVTKRVLKQVDAQISDRLEGILLGMKVRMNVEQARIEEMQKEIAELQLRHRDQLKHDLENLQKASARLKEEAQANAAKEPRDQRKWF